MGIGTASSIVQPVPPPQHLRIRSPARQAPRREWAMRTILLPMDLGFNGMLISSKFSGAKISSITALAKKRDNSFTASGMSNAVSSADYSIKIKPFTIYSTRNTSVERADSKSIAISFSLFFCP